MYYVKRCIDDLNFNSGYTWDNTLERCDIKLYDHQDHLKAMSIRFPNVLFILEGEGEEHGDVWKKYFSDGKMQKIKVKIVFEEDFGWDNLR